MNCLRSLCCPYADPLNQRNRSRSCPFAECGQPVTAIARIDGGTGIARAALFDSARNLLKIC